MSKLFVLLCILMCATSIFGTGQEADKIIYHGTERMLFSNPLEDYYKDPDKRPGFMVAPMTTSTGNWRGYIASWEIVDGKLFLTEVDSWLCDNYARKDSCHKVKLTELFGRKVSNGKVLADWYTGELRVPDGKELRYVHMGYGSTYERDLIFRVKSGNVSEPEIIDNTKAKLPSETEVAFKELEKLKQSPLGEKPAFGPATAMAKSETKLEPKSGIVIVPGQGVFSVGTKRVDLEAVLGDGKADSNFDDVYFVEYPKAGVQVSYENSKNTVHVFFLYNQQARYEGFAIPVVKTDKGIDWNATPDDILKAYGKPKKDFSDEGPAKSWRRLEYPGIDFLFQGGRLGRIGILGPDGN